MIRGDDESVWDAMAHYRAWTSWHYNLLPLQNHLKTLVHFDLITLSVFVLRLGKHLLGFHVCSS